MNCEGHSSASAASNLATFTPQTHSSALPVAAHAGKPSRCASPRHGRRRQMKAATPFPRPRRRAEAGPTAQNCERGPNVASLRGADYGMRLLEATEGADRKVADFLLGPVRHAPSIGSPNGGRAGLQRNRSPRVSTARMLQRALLLVALLCSFSLMTAVVTTPRGDGPVALPHHTGSAVVVAAARADGDVDDIVTFSQAGDVFALEESASASVPSSSSSGVSPGANGRGSKAARAPETPASSSSLSVEPLPRGSSAVSSLRRSLLLPSAADIVVVLVGEGDAGTELPPSSSAPPPDNFGTRRAPAMRLALLGLIALVVPAAIIALAMWCVCRRTRYKRKVKGLRLNGTRQPGEVDDVDMGNIVRGGDWLNLDAATPGRTKIGANGARFSILAPSTAACVRMDATFDPIGQQAAETRQRKQDHCFAVEVAELNYQRAVEYVHQASAAGAVATPARRSGHCAALLTAGRDAGPLVGLQRVRCDQAAMTATLSTLAKELAALSP
ncbi:putative integral membrane protein [Leishmania donovani]|uniref:Putative integral membrane protein n=1 Tax=Leishmania donovani TaxID=5661 RepID=A0A504Y939_LEIDO|nr:putative integral membrane protein [Leishmania donovani]TPP54089.1 putative integral membrane protein [Leishmania donovani]TPP54091.1 putative integral membrane protein [Leishmania donovani]